MKRKNITLLLAGMGVSDLGSAIQSVAIPLFVLQLTSSAISMSMVVFASMVTGILMMPFAGVISDRWNKRNAMVMMDLTQGVILLVMAVLAYKNMLTMEVLIVTTVFRSGISAFFQTSSDAFFIELAYGDSLRSINSLSRSIDSATQLAGPAIGGMLFGFLGITVVLVVNGISYILSGISEMFIEYSHVKRHDKLSVTSFFTEFGEGIKAIRSIKGFVPMLLFFAVMNMIDAPIIPIFLPFVGKEVLGFSATNIGLLTSAYTFGALVSGLLIATLLKKMDSKKMCYLGIITAPLFQIIFAFMIFPQSLALIASTMMLLIYSLVLYFMMGFTDSLVNVPLMTKIQMIIPEDLRGRAYSVMSIISSVFIPMGFLIYGFLLDYTPPHYLLLGMSVITLVLSVVMQRFIPWKSFEKES